jgi:hypothetical protein
VLLRYSMILPNVILERSSVSPNTTNIDRLADRLVNAKLSQIQMLRLIVAIGSHATPAEARIIRQRLTQLGLPFSFTFTPGGGIAARVRRRISARHKYARQPSHAHHDLVVWANEQESIVQSARIAEQGGSYTRSWRKGGAEFFRGLASEKRHLVIAVTGLEPRMMMPLEIFFACIGDRPADILKLEQPRPGGYNLGVTGLASNFADLVLHLREFIEVNSYERITVLGSSSGGLPAVLIGRLLDAETVWVASPLSISGPRSSEVMFTEWLETASMRHSSQEVPQKRSHLIIYGGAMEADGLAAAELQTYCPEFQTLEVPGAGHNSLYPLAKTGELSILFNEFPWM